jgi:hypothetical protein
VALLAFVVVQVKAIQLPYDVNGDGKVDTQDLAVVAEAFGSCLGKPKWDVKADVNGDGKVDIADLGVIAAHFGETDPILVVPEYWMGPMLGLAGCFAASGLFRIVKHKRQ